MFLPLSLPTAQEAPLECKDFIFIQIMAIRKYTQKAVGR